MKKKTRILLAIIAVVSIGIFMINACSKSDQEGTANPGRILKFSPPEDQVVPLITQFNQRYENHKAGFKSGGDMNLGEAEWTIEAAVNYEYKGEKENLEELTLDSLSLNADVFLGANNEYFISETSAFSLYEEINEFTANQVTEENKLLVADVELQQIVNGVADIKLTTVILLGLPNPCELKTNDHWYAAANAGRCGGYSGGVGQDAADKIRILLNCSPADNGYWTSIETIYDVVYYLDPYNNPCFWGMEYTGDWDDCLSPTEIDYWYDQARYVIGEEEPPTKDFIDCYFTSDLLLGDGTYFHYFQWIRYGIFNEGDPE